MAEGQGATGVGDKGYGQASQVSKNLQHMCDLTVNNW